MRNLSASLPFFNNSPQDERQAEKEKAGRGKCSPNRGGAFGNLKSRAGRLFWKMRLRLVIVLAFLFFVLCFYATRK